MLAPAQSHAAAVANVTRRAFTVDLAQQLDLQPATGVQQTFSDLPPSDPSYGLIMAAYRAGWISGYPNGTFQPGASLTREQVAKCEIIALGLSGAAAALAAQTPSYADASQIGKWAWGYVNEAQAIGILRGFTSSTFGPQSTFTQAQIRHAQSQLASYLATTPVKAFATLPTAAPGSAAGTAAITVTPYAASDRVAVLISSIPLSVPNWGAQAPSGAIAYSPGSDLPVTPNAYVGVYEVGAQNVVSAFSQLQVTAGEIAEPPSGLSLSGPASGAVSEQASVGPFTLTLVDQSGNPATAPAGGETVALSSNAAPGTYTFATAASGPSVSSVTVPQGEESATFYYGGTTAGAPLLLATSPSLGSTSLSVQVTAGAPTRLALTGPTSGQSDVSPTIGPFTLSLTDAYGNPAPAPAGGLPVTLASSSPGPDEFSLTAGGPAVTNLVIPAGAQSLTFYYGDVVGGQPTLTATAQGLASATLSLQVQAAISAVPSELALSGPQTGAAGAQNVNGPFTVTVTDQSGNPAAAPASGYVVTLGSSSQGVYSFTTTPGGPPVTSLTIPAGGSSATFYYQDSQPGVTALSAQAPGLSSASDMLEIATTVNLAGTGLDSPTSPATQAQVQAWLSQGYRNIFLNTFVSGFAQQYAVSLQSMNVILFQGYWTSAFTTETGAQRAQQAIKMAQSVDYPKGAYIFVDVESTGSATEQQMVGWINSWAGAVQAAGYGAGVYFGVPQPVKSADTPSILADRFWKSYSGTSITPAPRGVCVVQTGTTGALDTDTFTVDNLGGYCVGAGL